MNLYVINTSLDIVRIIQQQLFKMENNIDETMKSSKIVFIEFSKAFDRISFNILTQKLHELHFS